MSGIASIFDQVPSWILQALNFGAEYPEGDEDNLFALGNDWKATAAKIKDLEPEIAAVIAATKQHYSGPGADAVHAELDRLLTGDQSMSALEGSLNDLGAFTRRGGTDLEYTKILEGIFAIITAISVAYLLASAAGSAAVPASLAVGRQAVATAAERGMRQLMLQAARSGLRTELRPFLKNIAIKGGFGAGIGAGGDSIIQGYQLAMGHRDGYDVAQTLRTALEWGGGALIAAPAGQGLKSLLGLTTLRPPMAGLLTGAGSGAAAGVGMYGGNLGFQFGDKLFHPEKEINYEFDPQLIYAGVGLGGIHGAAQGFRAQRAANGQAMANTLANDTIPGRFTDNPARQVEAGLIYDRAKEIEANGKYSRQEIAELNDMRSRWDGRELPGDGTAPRVTEQAPRTDVRGSEGTATRSPEVTARATETAPRANDAASRASTPNEAAPRQTSGEPSRAAAAEPGRAKATTAVPKDAAATGNRAAVPVEAPNANGSKVAAASQEGRPAGQVREQVTKQEHEEAAPEPGRSALPESDLARETRTSKPESAPERTIPDENVAAKDREPTRSDREPPDDSRPPRDDPNSPPSPRELVERESRLSPEAAERILEDYHRSDMKTLSEAELLTALEGGKHHAGRAPHEVAAYERAVHATVEVIRRGTETVEKPDGKTLRPNQIMATMALSEGPINMAAGQGKTFVFIADAMLRAINGDMPHVYTTRGTLANDMINMMRQVFDRGLGEGVIDVARITAEGPSVAAPKKPTVFVGTLDEAAFGHLRGKDLPGELARLDEIDEALIYADTTWQISDSASLPAAPEVKANVEWAHDFLGRKVESQELRPEHFGRTDFTQGHGSARLTPEGSREVARLLENEGDRPRIETIDQQVARVDSAAAARWELVKNDHYVIDPTTGKIYIIDQTTHRVLLDPATGSESRWNGGLAQAVEAHNNLIIRGDSQPSLSIRAEQFLPSHYTEMSGASGTAKGVSAEMNHRFNTAEVIDIPSHAESRAYEMPSQVKESQAAKHEAIADDVAARYENSIRAQLVIVDRNSEVHAISKLLTERGVKHIAIDGDWQVQRGVRYESDLRAIADQAGAEKHVLVINRQGGRGMDIEISETVEAAGGLHVVISGKASVHDIDVQAQKRTGRNGGEGSWQHFLAADDALYAHKPQHAQTVTRYVAAEESFTTAERGYTEAAQQARAARETADLAAEHSGRRPSDAAALADYESAVAAKDVAHRNLDNAAAALREAAAVRSVTSGEMTALASTIQAENAVQRRDAVLAGPAYGAESAEPNLATHRHDPDSIAPRENAPRANTPDPTPAHTPLATADLAPRLSQAPHTPTAWQPADTAAFERAIADAAVTADVGRASQPAMPVTSVELPADQLWVADVAGDLVPIPAEPLPVVRTFTIADTAVHELQLPDAGRITIDSTLISDAFTPTTHRGDPAYVRPSAVGAHVMVDGLPTILPAGPALLRQSQLDSTKLEVYGGPGVGWLSVNADRTNVRPRRATGPLFPDDGPLPTDITLDTAQRVPLMASLRDLAATDPARITAMITEDAGPGVRAFTVRLRDSTTGEIAHVTVDDAFHTDPTGQLPHGLADAARPLWPAVIEKAWTVHRESTVLAALENSTRESNPDPRPAGVAQPTTDPTEAQQRPASDPVHPEVAAPTPTPAFSAAVHASIDRALANSTFHVPDLDSSRTIGAERLAPLEDPDFLTAVRAALLDPTAPPGAERFLIGADPRFNSYGHDTNDGGVSVAGRWYNCVETSLAALSSFLGRPAVAWPRTTESWPDGSLDERGELGGFERAQEWLDRPWENFADHGMTIPEQFAALHELIADMGTGAAALVYNRWQLRDESDQPLVDDEGNPAVGSDHLTVVVFPHGSTTPVWWDPQSREMSERPPATLTDYSADLAFISLEPTRGSTRAAAPADHPRAGSAVSHHQSRGNAAVPDHGVPALLGVPVEANGNRAGSPSRDGLLRGASPDRGDHGPLERQTTAADRRGVRPSSGERATDHRVPGLSAPIATESAPTPGESARPGSGRPLGGAAEPGPRSIQFDLGEQTLRRVESLRRERDRLMDAMRAESAVVPDDPRIQQAAAKTAAAAALAGTDYFTALGASIVTERVALLGSEPTRILLIANGDIPDRARIQELLATARTNSPAVAAALTRAETRVDFLRVLVVDSAAHVRVLRTETAAGIAHWRAAGHLAAGEADAGRATTIEDLVGQRDALNYERHLQLIKRDERAHRLGIENPDEALSAHNIELTIRQLFDRIVRRENVAPGVDLDASTAAEEVSEHTLTERRTEIAKLQAAAWRVVKLDWDRSAFSQRIIELTGRSANADFSPEVLAELDALALARVQATVAAEPYRVMREDIAARSAAATVDPVEYQRLTDLLAEATRRVESADNVIGRALDQMALLRGAGRTEVLAQGGRMLTDRVGLVAGESQRLIVLAPREALDTPLHELDAALEAAVRLVPAATRAFQTPSASVEFKRLIADDNGTWQLVDVAPPQRLMADQQRTRLAQHLPAAVTGWRDAAGNLRFVDPSQPWTTGRSQQPKWFGDGKERDPTKEQPKGITGWGMNPIQTSVLGNFETLPPGHVFEALTPTVPGALEHLSTPFEAYASPIDGLLYNVARLLLETVGVFAGMRLRRDPLNPERLMTTYKWHRLLSWFDRKTNPDYRPPVDVQPRIHQWDAAEHAELLDAPSVPLRERQRAEQQAWARVQTWANAEYQRFRADDRDIELIIANLAAHDESIRIRQADKVIDRVQNTFGRLNPKFDSANEKEVAKALAKLPEDIRTRVEKALDRTDHKETTANDKVRTTLTAWVADQLREEFRETVPNLIDAIVAREAGFVDRVTAQLAGLTFTRDDIAQIKNHLMRDPHLVLDRRTGNPTRQPMDAVADIAEAWSRLAAGAPLDEDIVLLRNSLAGSKYLADNPDAFWREGDRHAISLGLDWSSQRPPAAPWRIDIKYAPRPLELESSPLPSARELKSAHAPDSALPASPTSRSTPNPTESVPTPIQPTPSPTESTPTPIQPTPSPTESLRSDLAARARAAAAEQRQATDRITDIAAGITGLTTSARGPRALAVAVIDHVDAELLRSAPEPGTMPTSPDDMVRMVWERLARDRERERLAGLRAGVERQLTRYLDARTTERELRDQLHDVAVAEAFRAAGALVRADRVGIIDGAVPRALVVSTDSATEQLIDDQTWRELVAAGTEISFQRVIVDDTGAPHLVDWPAPSEQGRYRTANERLDAIERRALGRLDEIVHAAMPTNAAFVLDSTSVDRVDEARSQAIARSVTARAAAVAESAAVTADSTARTGGQFAIELADIVAEFTTAVEQQQAALEVALAPGATWTYGAPRPHETSPQIAATIADQTTRANRAMARAKSAADALTEIYRILVDRDATVGPRTAHEQIGRQVAAGITAARAAVNGDDATQADQVAGYQEIRTLRSFEKAAAAHLSTYGTARAEAQQLAAAATELAIADVLAAAGITRSEKGVGVLPGAPGRVLVAFDETDPHQRALSAEDHWERLTRGEQLSFQRVFVDEHGQVHVVDTELRDPPRADGLDTPIRRANAGGLPSIARAGAIAAPAAPAMVAGPRYDIVSTTTNESAAELRIRLHLDLGTTAASGHEQRAQAIVDAAHAIVFESGRWYSPLSGEPYRFTLDLVDNAHAAHLRPVLPTEANDIDDATRLLAVALRDHLGLASTSSTPNGLTLDEHDVAALTREARLGGLRLAAPDIHYAFTTVRARQALAPLESPSLQVALEQAARSPEGGYVRGFDPRISALADLINPGGFTAPGRGDNCWTVVASALLTFLGDPQVAPPVRDSRAAGTATTMADWLRAGAVSWRDREIDLSSFEMLQHNVAELGPGAAAPVFVGWQDTDSDGNLRYHEDGTPVLLGHAFLVVNPLDAPHPVWWCPQEQATWDQPPDKYVENARILIAIPLLPDGTPALDYTDPYTGGSPAVHHPSSAAHRLGVGLPVRVRLDSDLETADPGQPAGHAGRNSSVHSEFPDRGDHQPSERSETLLDRPVHRGDENRGATAGPSALPAAHPDTPETDVQRNHAGPLSDPTSVAVRGQRTGAGLSADDRQAGLGLQSDVLSRHADRGLDPAAASRGGQLAGNGSARGLDEQADIQRAKDPLFRAEHALAVSDGDGKASGTENRGLRDADIPAAAQRAFVSEHGETHTTISPDELTNRVAANLRNIGHHDVIVHGDESGLPIDATGDPIDPRLIIDAIRANPNYQPGTPIRLVSCKAGTDAGWAQQLADALGVEVHAPTEIVGVRSQPNSAAIVHNDGHWRTFHPEPDGGDRPVPPAPATGELAVDRTSATRAVYTDFLTSDSPTSTPGFDISHHTGRHPRTELTLRIHLRPIGDITPTELTDVHELIRRVAAEIFGEPALSSDSRDTAQYPPMRLPDGTTLRVRTEFVDEPHDAHLRAPVTRVRGLIPHGIAPDATPHEVAMYLRDHFGLQPFNNTPDQGMRLDGMELYELRDEITHQVIAANTRSPLPSIADARAYAFHPPIPLEHQHYQEELRTAALDVDRYIVGFDPRTHPVARLINPGGLSTTSRTANCWEAAIAAIKTFFGDPTVARAAQEINLPGRLPEYRGIGDDSALRRWLGAESVDFARTDQVPGSPADRLHASIAELGQGAASFVGLTWPGGMRHIMVVVYPHGASAPVWWDAQSQETWDTPPHDVRALSELTAIPLLADGSPYRVTTDQEHNTSEGIPRQEPPMGNARNGDSRGIHRGLGDSTPAGGSRKPDGSANHDLGGRYRSDLPASELVAESSDRAVSESGTERGTTWSPDLPLPNPNTPDIDPRRGRPGAVPAAPGVTDPTRPDRTGARPDHLHEELGPRPIGQPVQRGSGPHSEPVRDPGHLAPAPDRGLLTDTAHRADESSDAYVATDQERSTSPRIQPGDLPAFERIAGDPTAATSHRQVELFDPTAGGRRAALALEYVRATTGSTTIQVPDQVGPEGLTFDEFAAAAGHPRVTGGTLSGMVDALTAAGNWSSAVYYQWDDALAPWGMPHDTESQQARAAYLQKELNTHAGVAIHHDGQISFYDPATHTISTEVPTVPMSRLSFAAFVFDSYGIAVSEPRRGQDVETTAGPRPHRELERPPTPHDGPTAGGRRVELALAHLRDSTGSPAIQAAGEPWISMSETLTRAGHRSWTTLADPGWVAGHLALHGPGSAAFIVELRDHENSTADLNSRSAVLTNHGNGLITIYDPAMGTFQEYRPSERTITPTRVLFYDADGHPIEPATAMGERGLTDEHVTMVPRLDQNRKSLPVSGAALRRQSTKDNLASLLYSHRHLEQALRDNTFTPTTRELINSIDQALETLPEYAGIVHHTTTMSWNEVSRFQEGGFFQEPGYLLATTRNFEPARADVNVHFTIAAKSAKNLGDPVHIYRRRGGNSAYNYHSDIVFVRGTSFSVANRVLDPQSGILHIDVVELAAADAAKPSRRELVSDYTEPDTHHRATLAVNHVRNMTGSTFIQPQPVDQNQMSLDAVGDAIGRKPTVFRDPAWIEAYLRGHGQGSMAIICVQSARLTDRGYARDHAYNARTVADAVDAGTYVLTNNDGDVSLYDPATQSTAVFSETPHYRQITAEGELTGFITYFIDPDGVPIAPTEPGRTRVADIADFQRASAESAGFLRGRVSPRPISLSSTDRAALRDYDENLDSINEGLRTGAGLRWNASENFHRALAKFPDYRAIVHRVETLPIETLLGDYAPGATVRDAGHATASKNPPTARAGEVAFTILSSTGKDVGHYFGRHGDNSIVFGLGTEFRVISRELNAETGVMEIALMEKIDLHRALDVAADALAVPASPIAEQPLPATAEALRAAHATHLPVDIHQVADHGMTLDELATTIGRTSTPFTNPEWIVNYLRHHGTGSTAIVRFENQNTTVARQPRRARTAGVETSARGSDYFLLTNNADRISLYDPTNRTSTNFSDSNQFGLHGRGRFHTFFFDRTGAPMAPTEVGPTQVSTISEFHRLSTMSQGWYRRNVSPRSIYMTGNQKRGLRKFVHGNHTPREWIDFQNSLSHLPDYQGIVYRVDSLRHDTLIDDYRPGNFVSDHENLITSKKPVEADAGQVAFTILSGTGKDVSAYVRKNGEPVVVLERSTRFQVISRQLNSSTGVMEITLVEDSLLPADRRQAVAEATAPTELPSSDVPFTLNGRFEQLDAQVDKADDGAPPAIVVREHLRTLSRQITDAATEQHSAGTRSTLELTDSGRNPDGHHRGPDQDLASVGSLGDRTDQPGVRPARTDQERTPDARARSTETDPERTRSVLANSRLETGPAGDRTPGDRGPVDGRGDRYGEVPRVLTTDEPLVLRFGAREIAPVAVHSLPVEHAGFLQDLGRSTPDLYELEPADADFFHEQMLALQQNNRYAASVHVYELTEYRGMRLFVTDDGKSGIALKGDEIVSVYAHRDSRHPQAASGLIGIAVTQGGVRLDCFDTVLPDIYAFSGFVPVARIAWNDQYAPDGWDYNTFRRYNEGRPDVVFMAYDSSTVGSRYSPGSGHYVDSYDDGVAAAQNYADPDQSFDIAPTNSAEQPSTADPARTVPTWQSETISTPRYDFRQTIDDNGLPTTELTVRTYLEQTPDVTAAQMQSVARTIIEANTQIFGDPAKTPPAALFPERPTTTTTSTPRHTLTNGDGLRVDIEFVGNPDHAHLRASVALHPAEHGPHHWAPTVSAETVARAISEHVGITDGTEGLTSADIRRLSDDLAAAIVASPTSTLADVPFWHSAHSTTIGTDPISRRVSENLRNEGAHDVILHGDESGHPLDDTGAPLSPQQVADAILVNPNYVPGTPIRLVSCFSGSEVGWAQQLADRLGVPVHAPTDIVGVRQRPSSPAVVHNDGTWLTFAPNSVGHSPTPSSGARTSESATADGRGGWDLMAEEQGRPPRIENLYAVPETGLDSGRAAPAGPPRHEGPVPPGMVLGSDGLLHQPNDRTDSYRTDDGRWHHLQDRSGTFRDVNFQLRDASGWATDPLTSQDVIYKAQVGPTEVYTVRDDAIQTQIDERSEERQAQQVERDQAGDIVKSHMSEFGIARIHDLKTAELDRVIEQRQESILADRSLSDAEVDAKLDRLSELHENAKIYNDVGNKMVPTSKAMAELGGNAFTLDPDLHPNATMLSPFEGAFDGQKVVDIGAFVPATETSPPKFLQVECKGLGSTLGDATTEHGKAQQGSTEYGLHTPNIDQNLQRILTETHEDMRARGVDPVSPEGRRVIEAREDLTRALHDGTLRMEYHLVHARMDGTIEVSQFIIDGGSNTSIDAIGGIVRDAEYPHRSRDELQHVLTRENERNRDALLRGLDDPALLRAVPDAVEFSHGAREQNVLTQADMMSAQLSTQQASIRRELQQGVSLDGLSRKIAAAQEQAARVHELEIESRIAVFRDVDLGPHRDLVEKLIRLDVESRALPLTTEMRYNERVLLRDAKALAIEFREPQNAARAQLIEHSLELVREINISRGDGVELGLPELVKELAALEQVVQVERTVEARAIEAMGLDPRHVEQLTKLLELDRAGDFGRPIEALGREIVRQGTARAIEARELPALERDRVIELALTRVQEIERTLEQGREPGHALVLETADMLGEVVQAEREAEARTLEALGLSREHAQEIGKTLELERTELLGRSMEVLDKELVRQDHNRTVGDSKYRIGPELSKTLDARAYREISNSLGRGIEDRTLDAGDKTRQPPALEYDSRERRLAIAANLLEKGLALELVEVRMLVEQGQGISPDRAIRMVGSADRSRYPERGLELGRERERGLGRGR